MYLDKAILYLEGVFSFLRKPALGLPLEKPSLFGLCEELVLVCLPALPAACAAIFSVGQ